MRRAIRVLAAGTWAVEHAVDRLILPYDQRYRRRFRFRAEGGLDLLLDLDRAVVLTDGDGLGLDDGGIVLVRAEAEPLIEVQGQRPGDLVRFAYHLGNRHLPVQIADARLLIRFDPVIRDMLQGLGATVHNVSAPFTPEPGAYDEHDHHAGHPGGTHHHHAGPHGHDDTR